MNSLIKGQEIGIDDHSRGRETGWSKKLHIHKRFTDGRRGGFEILVPFNHDGEIDVRPGRQTGNDEYPSVRKEIKKALQRGQKRDVFVKDIAEAIARFSQGKATEDSCRAAAKRIADYFELDQEIISEIVETYRDILHSYRSYHVDPQDNSIYLIQQDKTHITISPRKNIPRSKKIIYYE